MIEMNTNLAYKINDHLDYYIFLFWITFSDHQA
jgi:hypothetical protein